MKEYEVIAEFEHEGQKYAPTASEGVLSTMSFEENVNEDVAARLVEEGKLKLKEPAA